RECAARPLQRYRAGCQHADRRIGPSRPRRHAVRFRRLSDLCSACLHRRPGALAPNAAAQGLRPYWAITLGHLWEHIEEFDVVHSHLDYFAYPMARASVRPVLTTLHGRLDQPEHQPLYRYFRDVPLVSISDAQRRPVPDANWLATM